MKTVYHIGSGVTQMPYNVDADNAVGRHPDEWSFEPWSADQTNAWRKADYDRQVADAKAVGLPPPPSPAEIQLSPEQKTAMDEDEARRAEARDIVAKADAMEREKRDWDAKVVAARGVLAQPLPQIEEVRQPASRVATNEPIPADWEGRTAPQRRMLAIRYLGAPNTIKGDEADAMIRAEVKKRADAKGQSDKATTAKTAEQEQRASVANTKPSATFEQPNPKPTK